jgi:NADP-dependent 3-hydroxy acid dehydrogenase YdfG
MPPQIVLVTGASAGIGDAIARRYAAAGPQRGVAG